MLRPGVADEGEALGFDAHPLAGDRGLDGAGEDGDEQPREGRADALERTW